MGACMSSSVGGGDIAHSASAVVAMAVKGSHVLKIDGYSRTKGLGKFIKSEPFDIGGHRWYIRYYPDSDPREGAGWVSFYLCLYHNNATGVQASIKFTLLDEVGEPVPSYCFSSNGAARTFKNQDIGWRYAKFITRKALEESTYLNDDSFRVRCEHKLCECINTSMATTTLLLAEQHGCKGLKNACFKFLKSPGHLKKVMDGDEFQHLTTSCPSLLNEQLANVAR